MVLIVWTLWIALGCMVILTILIIFLGGGLHSWHMEVPSLGFESELQLLAYAIATGTPDLSCVFNLYHSSWQHWVLNPLSGTRDCYHWATIGTPRFTFFFFLFFCLFRAAPAAYGSSQVRGQIGAAAASATATGTQDWNRVCNLYHSSRQHWILNPHWMGPVIKLTSSWILVSFFTAETQ